MKVESTEAEIKNVSPNIANAIVVGSPSLSAKNSYGKELILDLHNCDENMFTRKYLKKYFKSLCKKIDMKRSKLCWWDDVGVPEEEQQTSVHTKGTSAVQFILTSNITVHTLELTGHVYVNIFSCKDFNSEHAELLTKEYFKGEVKQSLTVDRI